jgi:hypothetical protein
MDDDQIGALRDFVSAAWHYLTASKPDAPARRTELCEAVGALLFALEGPLPDDPEGGDNPDGNNGSAPPNAPEAHPRPRLVENLPPGATVIPLHGRRRISRRPKRDRR